MKMKTKNKMIVLVEMVVVLCLVFLMTLPAIAADQDQEMLKAYGSADTPKSFIYGDANEDGDVNMRDVTYIKLVIFSKKPATDFSDANYDGEISMLDMAQTELIILDKERQLTLLDQRGRTVTIQMPKPSSIMVYSGAGMRKPMDELGQLFEQEGYYGVSVNYNYGGSNTLLSQIELTQQGDVYMPGATYYIDKAKEKGFVDYEQLVAYHIPVIVVPDGNPADITCLEDLTKPGVKVVLGDAKAAACGKIANKILDENGIFDAVDVNVIARTATVNELVVDICLGTADASIVWKASLLGTDKETDIIEIPKEQNIIKIIPIGTLTFSENKGYAELFVDFVTSDEGKAIFNKYGFTPYLNEKYA